MKHTIFIVCLLVTLTAIGSGFASNEKNKCKKKSDVPSGIVMFWPAENGAIPNCWSIYELADGRMLLGTDGTTFMPGSVGGSMTFDLAHNHNLGALTTDVNSHAHDGVSLSPTSAPPDNANVARGWDMSVATDAHTHDILGQTAHAGHSHNISGNTDTKLLPSQSILPPYIVGAWIQKD